MGHTECKWLKRSAWEAIISLTPDLKKMVFPGVMYQFGHQWQIDGSWIHENIQMISLGCVCEMRKEKDLRNKLKRHQGFRSRYTRHSWPSQLQVLLWQKEDQENKESKFRPKSSLSISIFWMLMNARVLYWRLSLRGTHYWAFCIYMILLFTERSTCKLSIIIIISII